MPSKITHDTILRPAPDAWYKRTKSRHDAFKKMAKGLIRTGIAKDSTNEAQAGIANDDEFVNCFVETSPTITSILKDEKLGVRAGDLVKEARILHEALGDSRVALHTDNKTSKYAAGFSFAPEIEPATDLQTTSLRDMVCAPDVTDEGPVPTFFQFERTELPTILKRYAQHPGHHGPDHICRSLILGKAMANFYLSHGQKQYLPMAQVVSAARDTTPAHLPRPGDKEVDISTICFAIGFHDSGRTTDGPDVWEHQSGRNAYYYMRNLHYSIEYAGNVADIIVKNEGNASAPKRLPISRAPMDESSSFRNSARNDAVEVDDPGCINEMITHDADTLEIHRVLAGRVSDNTFREDQLKFLNCTDFDEGVSVPDRKGARAALIADAKNLAELTSLRTVKGVNEKAALANSVRFVPFAVRGGHPHTGFDSMHAEYERFILDEIFKDPKAFPFFYKYYFLECFDPSCPQLALLSSEQRLALIRTRMHAMERSPRDRHWAAGQIQKFNTANGVTYDIDQLNKAVLEARLTMNFTYETLVTIVKDLTTPPVSANPLYKHFWSVFWATNTQRQGGGASTSPDARDDAERWKLNYITSHKDPAFRPICHERPNYAGVNFCQSPIGSVGKYGKCCVFIKRHVTPRITYTFNDTFGTGVMPDHACSPSHPHALFRHIMPVLGVHPDLLGGLGDRMGWNKDNAFGKQGKGLRNALIAGTSAEYIEAHVHGPLSWKDDIEAIVIEVTSSPASAREKQKTEPKGDYDVDIKSFADTWGITLAYAKAGVNAVFKTRKAAEDARPDQAPSASDTIDLFAPPPPPPKPAKQPKQVTRELKRTPSTSDIVIIDYVPDKDEVRPPRIENESACDLFEPNPWKPSLCKHCQGVPRSEACKNWGKSNDEPVTWTSEQEAKQE